MSSRRPQKGYLQVDLFIQAALTSPLGNVHLLLVTLPFDLRLAKITAEQLRKNLPAVLDVLFFQRQDHARFVSFTRTPEEISLVLQNEDLQFFEDGVLEVADGHWRGMQICEGSFGFNASGIISKVTGPLARASISVFNFSTYDTDYIMTEREKLEDALHALKRNLTIHHSDYTD